MTQTFYPGDLVRMLAPSEFSGKVTPVVEVFGSTYELAEVPGLWKSAYLELVERGKQGREASDSRIDWSEVETLGESENPTPSQAESALLEVAEILGFNGDAPVELVADNIPTVVRAFKDAAAWERSWRDESEQQTQRADRAEEENKAMRESLFSAAVTMRLKTGGKTWPRVAMDVDDRVRVLQHVNDNSALTVSIPPLPGEQDAMKPGSIREESEPRAGAHGIAWAALALSVLSMAVAVWG